MRILVAEDDAPLAEFLHQRFVQEQFDVQLVASAADVLARCRVLHGLGARHLSFGPPLGPDPITAIRQLGDRVLPVLEEIP